MNQVHEWCIYGLKNVKLGNRYCEIQTPWNGPSHPDDFWILQQNGPFISLLINNPVWPTVDETELAGSGFNIRLRGDVFVRLDCLQSGQLVKATYVVLSMPGEIYGQIGPLSFNIPVPGYVIYSPPDRLEAHNNTLAGNQPKNPSFWQSFRTRIWDRLDGIQPIKCELGGEKLSAYPGEYHVLDSRAARARAGWLSSQPVILSSRLSR